MGDFEGSGLRFQTQTLRLCSTAENFRDICHFLQASRIPAQYTGRRQNMADITFAIVKHLGIISPAKGDWKKELNLVSWNGRNPKLDVRDWAPGHARMSKGITLTTQQGAKLAELLTEASVT